jgi:hypothetical protein
MAEKFDHHNSTRANMNDYMLRVLNAGTAQDDWPKPKHLEFVRECETYINDLQSRGQLVAAQPLARQGVLVERHGEQWDERPLDLNTEVQVGYYLVRAANLADAIQIAKGNPEFHYGTSARVEVRPLTAEEAVSGYAYPKLTPA